MTERPSSSSSSSSSAPPPTPTHLYEPEDSEGRRAVVAVREADDAEELSVEAAVAEAEQEAAEEGQVDAEDTDVRTDGVKNQPQGSQTQLSSFLPF